MMVDANHPGWKLSRACIHDTYMAKRTGVFKKKNRLLTAVCATNLKLLRETQLAPHIETRMITDRYEIRHAINASRIESCKCCNRPSNFADYVRLADNEYIKVLLRNHLFVCDACLKDILDEVDSNSSNAAVIYVEGGNVEWVAIPEEPIASYVVADYDSYRCCDEEASRNFVINFLMAHKPGMILP